MWDGGEVRKKKEWEWEEDSREDLEIRHAFEQFVDYFQDRLWEIRSVIDDQLQMSEIVEIRPRDEAVNNALDEGFIVVLLYVHCDLF